MKVMGESNQSRVPLTRFIHSRHNAANTVFRHKLTRFVLLCDVSRICTGSHLFESLFSTTRSLFLFLLLCFLIGNLRINAHHVVICQWRLSVKHRLIRFDRCTQQNSRKIDWLSSSLLLAAGILLSIETSIIVCSTLVIIKYRQKRTYQFPLPGWFECIRRHSIVVDYLSFV